MSDLAIRVEGLGKRYRLGERAGYRVLRDTLANALARPFRRGHGRPDEWISALRDVSFDVRQGEVIGVIGRNGAGKTTLLRVLSRITKPTTGRAEIHGRVGSLLEVGTGFHPELTGRENVYLNGSILGMRKREIDAKFDEIVSFAEVERFIDTPVKYYSSGMHVRLAFAVAAHLEPEILLIDEVLAVGDMDFQKKSERKMRGVAREGRTVLLVSHNMIATSMICDRAILLAEGAVAAVGPIREVIERYRSVGASQFAEVAWPFEAAPTMEGAKLRAVRVRNANGAVAFDLDIHKPITVEMEFWILQPTTIVPAFHIADQNGLMLFGTQNSRDEALWYTKHEPGLYRSRCTIPGSMLQDGQYYVTAILNRDPNQPYAPAVSVTEVISFRIHDTGMDRGAFIRDWVGVIRPQLPWELHRLPSEELDR